jgi:hypothetical protein
MVGSKRFVGTIVGAMADEEGSSCVVAMMSDGSGAFYILCVINGIFLVGK